MRKVEVMLAKLTRREFREALEDGKFLTAVIPVGSNEQHLEHLAMEHDMATVTHIAREAVLGVYPRAIVSVPMAVGISEHHMTHRGTVSAKPGSWLAVLFDAVESLVRHGARNVLILNGHGGNVAPVQHTITQWRLFFKMTAPEASLHFCSYWDLIPKEFAQKHLKTGRMPGHAQEFETAMAMALFPENVRPDAMADQADREPLEATAEQGRLLLEETVGQVTDHLTGIIEGRIRAPEVTHLP